MDYYSIGQFIADHGTFLQTSSQESNQTPFQTVPASDSRVIMTLPKELQGQLSVELSREALAAHISYCRGFRGQHGGLGGVATPMGDGAS